MADMNRADIRRRVFGRCGKSVSEKGNVVVDYSVLLERLLLFDTVVLDTLALKELPHLIRVFGFDPVLALFKAGAVQLGIPSVHVGLWGPAKHYNYHSFGAIRVDEDELLQRWFHDLRESLKLNEQGYTNLFTAINTHALRLPQDAARELIAQFRNDLTNGVAGIKEAIGISAFNLLSRKVDVKDLKISIEYTGNGETAGTDGYRTESNVATVLRVDRNQANRVIRDALISIGGVNRCVSEMKHFNALSGCQDRDIPIFDQKLRFLEKSFSPDTQIENFHRVLTITNFPDLGQAALDKKVDLMKLLEIRESREIQEFRTWIWSLDSVEDKDIIARITSMRSALTKAFHSKTGKWLRWVVTNGIGLIPVVGQVLGPALDALDSFLLERVLPESGVLMFINDLYPSIFRRS